MYWSLRNESAHEFGIRIAIYSGASDMYNVLKHKKVSE